ARQQFACGAISEAARANDSVHALEVVSLGVRVLEGGIHADPDFVLATSVRSRSEGHKLDSLAVARAGAGFMITTARCAGNPTVAGDNSSRNREGAFA